MVSFVKGCLLVSRLVTGLLEVGSKSGVLSSLVTDKLILEVGVGVRFDFEVGSVWSVTGDVKRVFVLVLVFLFRVLFGLAVVKTVECRGVTGVKLVNTVCLGDLVTGIVVRVLVRVLVRLFVDRVLAELRVVGLCEDEVVIRDTEGRIKGVELRPGDSLPSEKDMKKEEKIEKKTKSVNVKLSYSLHLTEISFR